MADWQHTYNGFTFGDGQNGIDTIEWQGLDMPEIVTHDVPRADGFGAFAGLDFYGGRSMLFVGELVADDAAAMETASNLLRRATNIQTGELPLTFDLPGQPIKRIDCRPRRRRIPVNHRWSMQSAELAIQFDATDPRFYADAADTVPIALTATGSLPNDGDVETKWVATISGPVTNPKLTHVGTGLVLDFSYNGGLVVPSGQNLVIDSRARTAVLNGVTNAFIYKQPTDEFFPLGAGANSVTFTAAAGTGSCSIEYRDAWGALT